MKVLKYLALAILGFAFATGAIAQTPVPGTTAVDDTPSIKLGAVVFGDYTYIDSPKATDVDGNKVKIDQFNITRSYLNVTGNLSHRLAFRVTPDIAKESGSGSSLAGSYTFRLKFAYGELKLDDWTTKGSYVRFGLTQTPYVDYFEQTYHYRFQGSTFTDREGYLPTADYGVAGRYAFPGNYGDVVAGIYNGEGYTKSESNDQKALETRVAVRPFPQSNLLKGFRIAGFYYGDHYAKGDPKDRFVAAGTYESKAVNAGVEYLSATDQKTAADPEVDSHGWSAFVNPKFGHGWEALLRHDELKPNNDASGTKRRNIAGVAYWIPLQKVTSAVMLDYDDATYHDFASAKPDETRYAIHVLINY